MGHSFRINNGSKINQDRFIQFSFNGKVYNGHQGDTLASALLANGITVTGRSFKYHRPRGIFSDGVEEPNALLQLESGPYTLPNMQATQVELYDGLMVHSQNCWPSLQFDIAGVFQFLSAVLPAGFYNKTFMWPRSFWKYYEHWIRKSAGMGCSPVDPDPDQYDQVNMYTDILIIGAGPAGLMAAYTAARSGCRVTLVEHLAWLGGRSLVETNLISGKNAEQWVGEIHQDLTEMENVTLLTRTTAFGSFESNSIYCIERINDHLPPRQRNSNPRQRLWRIRSKKIVLAAGAIERPLIFKNNDRPGVMLASSISSYIRYFGVLPGRVL